MRFLLGYLQYRGKKVQKREHHEEQWPNGYDSSGVIKILQKVPIERGKKYAVAKRD